MQKNINLSTIGFTKKTAQEFFEILKEANIKRVIDIRLNNVSQLAGFAKKKDLQYFLKEIADIDYIHLVDLAPTKEILDDYKKNKREWSVYEQKFTDLITKREIEKKLDPEIIEDSCLLCSEAKPHHCHRRLVAEYLSNHWGNMKINHL
ncbi:DUF488 domain-containing protein [Crocosphaera sp.]|uniref:DUF488 domain-containing protein n=1 Tax=Crocosphaera sp. TaxID=2729996 RepID=UPI00262661D3|nr:DUF488 domain-containing protein [Crocosphaera sp.]MDJ0581510.1 DUF488 domain-containing protein [Crocosphaera sp.]